MSERSDFLLSPSLEQLEKFKKDELLAIAKELDIDCSQVANSEYEFQKTLCAHLTVEAANHDICTSGFLGIDFGWLSSSNML